MFMPYDRPLYNRPPRRFPADYRTRVLLGVVCSLSVALLLLHLPMSVSPNRIGWSVRSSERIALTEVQEERPESRSTDRREAPPPTRYTPPDPQASTGTTPKASGQQGAADDARDTDSPAPIPHISALSFEAQKPEIIGGRGALYLQIDYPERARLMGIEGRLKLHFTVAEDGYVRNIEVGKSLHPLCDSAAVRAIRAVRFSPATRDGEAIPVRMSLPIRFELQPNPDALHSDRLSSSEE
jgi:TonB family protein